LSKESAVATEAPIDFGSYQHIRFERRGEVLLMVLNRPEKLNAVNGVMHTELVSAYRDLDRDEGSRAVVVTGAGRAFCAGGDITRMSGPSGSDVKRGEHTVHDEVRRLVDAILWVEKPVVAMVRGAASGLGATLALLSDVVVAAEDARFSDRHVNVGLVAGDGGAAIWPLLVGVNRAKELLMTGRQVTAAEAERIGLVNRVVPNEDLERATLELAAELAAQPPFALRATKAAINRQLRRAVEDVVDVSVAWERMSMAREDHHEAVRRFAEARAARR
jgi:enoyl-CoA hydratase